MSLGENLQYLRNRRGMTQEGLAESLNVSRQSVSKWEMDTCFPEMEKILQICEMFSCSMDTLIKGDVKEELARDNADYDKHMNSWAKSVAAGTAVVLTGITCAGIGDSIGQYQELFNAVCMLFILAAVMIFVVSGINHGTFVKHNPHISPFYREEQIRAFEQKFPVRIALGIGLIIMGAIISTTLSDYVYWRVVADNAVLVFSMVGVPIVVYNGLQMGKYDVESYNRDNSPDKKKSPYYKWYGIIMLLATLVYLLVSEIWHLWEHSWLAFAAGGILCGIVGIIERSNSK